jgi:hypothetical protein
MYFTQTNPEQHQAMYEKLMAHYDEQDSMYAAACYIVAYPEIIGNIPDADPGSNPFTWYWGKYDTVIERRLESELLLSLQEPIQHLARAGAELYAGRPLFFNMPEALQSWNEDMYNVFKQALELRRG